MRDRWLRGRFGASMATTVALGVLVVPLAACSGDEDSSSATTTTVDPLAEPVVDACGHDLSALTSTIWGVDPMAGAVRWTATVPLAQTYLLRDDSGNPRVSLVLRPVEAVVDAATGTLIGYPPAGVHEVLVAVPADPPDSGDGNSTLLVDGEAQPSTITVGGLRVTTSAGSTGQATIGITATDAATAAPAWRVDVGSADEVASVSRPVAFGDTVVVVTSPPQPACS